MKSVSVWLLGLSLLINVLLVGLILGWIAGASRGGPAGGPEPDFGGLGPRETGAVVRMLPPRERMQVLREGELGLRAMGQIRADIAQARRKVRDAALAEPYDPEAFLSAMEEMRATEFGVVSRVDRVLAAALERMSPEERTELFERLAADRRMGQPRRPGAGGRPDGGAQDQEPAEQP